MIGDEEPEPPVQGSGDTAVPVDNRQDETTVQEPDDVQAFVPHRHRICTLVHNKENNTFASPGSLPLSVMSLIEAN